MAGAVESVADAVVVGGGIAGLTCGVGLASRGLQVVVLEAHHSAGGRARSWLDEKTGDVVQLGPHVIGSHYMNMLRLMDILGTRDRIVWQEKGVLFTMVDGRRETNIRRSSLPPPFQMVGSLL